VTANHLRPSAVSSPAVPNGDMCEGSQNRSRPSRAALLDLLRPATPTRQFVAMAYWAPLLLPAITAPALSIGLSSVWSMSAFALIPVVLLSSPLIALHRKAMLATVAIAAVVPLLMVMAARVIAAHVSGENLKPSAAHASLLAKRIEREWRRVTYKPLNIVGGDQDLAFGVAFYLPSRPLALPAPDFDTTVRLVTPARLARDGMAITTDIIVGFPGETDDDCSAPPIAPHAAGFTHSGTCPPTRQRCLAALQGASRALLRRPAP